MSLSLSLSGFLESAGSECTREPKNNTNCLTKGNSINHTANQRLKYYKQVDRREGGVHRAVDYSPPAWTGLVYRGYVHWVAIMLKQLRGIERQGLIYWKQTAGESRPPTGRSCRQKITSSAQCAGRRNMSRVSTQLFLVLVVELCNEHRLSCCSRNTEC